MLLLIQCQMVEYRKTTTCTGIQKEHNSPSVLLHALYVYWQPHINGPDDYENVPDKYMDQVYKQKKAITDEFKERKPDYMKEQMEGDLGVPGELQGLPDGNRGKNAEEAWTRV